MTEKTRADLVEKPTLDGDEDGFHLYLTTDEEDFDFRIFDVETARALVASVQPLSEWVAEHDHHRAAYDRATPEERARVLRDEEALVEGDPDGWPYRGDAEALREQADHERKARKENPDG